MDNVTGNSVDPRAEKLQSVVVFVEEYIGSLSQIGKKGSATLVQRVSQEAVNNILDEKVADKESSFKILSDFLGEYLVDLRNSGKATTANIISQVIGKLLEEVKASYAPAKEATAEPILFDAPKQ